MHKKARLLFCLALISISQLTLLGQSSYQEYRSLSYEELDSVLAMHYHKGSYSKAIPAMEAARDNAQKEFGDVDSMVSNYVNYLGILYFQMGRYDEAMLYTVKAKDINGKLYGKEHSSYADALNNIGSLHYSIGNYAQALPLFIQAKDIYQKLGGNKLSATTLNNIAACNENLNNYEEALRFYKQAVELYEKTEDNATDLTLILSNMAKLHRVMGNLDQALEILQRCKKTAAREFGTNTFRFSDVLNSLGLVYRDQGAYAKALEMYVDALNIRSKLLAENHPILLVSMNNVALTYGDVGNYSKAWLYWSKAINSIMQKEITHDFSQTWLEEMKKVDNLSYTHLDKLISLLDVAYKLLTDNTEEKNAQKQIVIADLAMALLNRVMTNVSSERDKLSSLNYINIWLKRRLQALDSTTEAETAFELADALKSVLLLEAVKSEDAYRVGELPDSLVNEKEQLLKKRARLQAMLLAQSSTSKQDSLRNILNEHNQIVTDFLGKVKRQYPKYYAFRYQQKRATVGDIQQLLDNKTAVIEYLVDNSTLHLFKIDQKGVVWKQRPLMQAALSNKIKKFHQIISDYEAAITGNTQQKRAYVELAHWFYLELIQPILEGSEGLEKLVFITDGELGHLPFEAFLVEPADENVDYRDMHYLIRDFEISYNYSAVLWKENKAAPDRSNNGELFAMAGNYALEIADSLTKNRGPVSLLNRMRLSSLPAARQEVKLLEKQYKGFFAFDTLATEAILTEKISDYAVVHLAVHGLLEEKRPVLSSLALTEDGSQEYDNFWQAHEISSHELNADLVVLSACETGYGRFERGNGIASLARSFMYAGVPALIVSLWQVNDASTSELMQYFYRYLSENFNKAAALRQAKLDYIDQASTSAYAHPAFWSPFILMGDTEPVELAEKDSLTWAVYAAAVLLVLLLLFLFFQRKRR